MRTWGTLTVLVLALFVFMWAIDFVTLEGEWTLYGAQCAGGKWLDAERCSGKVEAGDRHRFRALKKKGEVVFWTVGSSQPSGKLAPCAIQSRSDWKCEAGGDAARAVTLEMRKGEAVPRTPGGTEAFHALPKWKWFLLRYGP